jgi:NAD(P)H-nitrite reductase large subunit
VISFVWGTFLPRPLHPTSSFFEAYYAARGVGSIKSTAVTELRGDGAVSSAVLRDGRSIPCELVVAGIGVQPAIEMLANSGLDVEDGVMVNKISGDQPSEV